VSSTFTDSGGHAVVYDLSGPEEAPLLVLAGSLGTSMRLWDPQLPALTSWYRVLRVEHPGHGGEPFPPGPYTAATLGQRILELVDHLGTPRFSFMGLSLGGMVGMSLAAQWPQRIERLVLCCTAPVIGPPDLWVDRARNARRDGTRPTAETLLGRWFTARFVAEHPSLVERLLEDYRQIDSEAYASCCDLLATTDLTSQLPRITAPTLVVAGALDPVVAPRSAADTMAAIKGAALIVLAGASHLANVEQAQAFNDAVVSHLMGSVIERGMATRRAVLGDAAPPQATGADFKRHFDELLTKMYWGEVWSRPGLDRRTRRLLNIGMLTALQHLDGIAVHARAALRDGVTPETLQEVLLQAAVCAGVPAANAARFVINRVIDEEAQARLGR
jgi:3-oxoadipate enol-lactonase/4-carboxymuconolactone decarboxylase